MRYVERMQLNDRTLERQRYKVMISGEKNWREHFYLAVLLWRLADVEENSLQVPPTQNAPAPEVLEYRKRLRTIQNYRQESLLHLEYLYHLPGVNAPALERFAYYSAHMHGATAIPYFYKLMEHPKVPDPRYYVVDFATLLLSDGRCSEAQAVFARGYPEEHAARAFFVDAWIHLCQPPVNLAHFRSLCARVPDGMWHDFIPILARAVWLNEFSMQTQKLPEICPEVASDPARSAHFAHVYANVAQMWSLPTPAIGQANLSHPHHLFGLVEPTFKATATLASFWIRTPFVTRFEFHAGTWHWYVPGVDLPKTFLLYVQSKLPSLPPVDNLKCPTHWIWEVKPQVVRTLPQ